MTEHIKEYSKEVFTGLLVFLSFVENIVLKKSRFITQI